MAIRIRDEDDRERDDQKDEPREETRKDGDEDCCTRKKKGDKSGKDGG